MDGHQVCCLINDRAAPAIVVVGEHKTPAVLGLTYRNRDLIVNRRDIV
jgi:hypothetical protein